MKDMRLEKLCSSWEKIAQDMLTESQIVNNRKKKERLQHKAAVNLNMAVELKSMMIDSLTSEEEFS